MSEIILDMGSGNTCRNDNKIVEKMIDAVAEVDSGKHKVIFKWQLFQELLPNFPLYHSVFRHAYLYAREKEYETTASVFDIHSLSFLLNFNIPFVKIACRPDLYWLIGEIPRKIEVYRSVKAWPNYPHIFTPQCQDFLCVPKYPAKIEEYEKTFELEDDEIWRSYCISDHTEGLELFRKYKPMKWEKHFVLERDKDNPDSGPFAILSQDLEEIL